MRRGAERVGMLRRFTVEAGGERGGQNSIGIHESGGEGRRIGEEELSPDGL